MSAASTGEWRLPKTDLTIEDARRKLAGWHFSQESLTLGEREILYVAEGLLRCLDDIMRWAEEGSDDLANTERSK